MSTKRILFAELVIALRSWWFGINGDQKNFWIHRWDIRLLMNKNGLNTIITWLEYHKSPNYARAFESKFKHLYKSNDDFYDKFSQSKFNKKSFAKQIQLLKNETKELVEYVIWVGCDCLDDKAIQQRFVGGGSDGDGNNSHTD